MPYHDQNKEWTEDGPGEGQFQYVDEPVNTAQRIVYPGMMAFTADGQQIGMIAECGEQSFAVDRGSGRMLSIPIGEVVTAGDTRAVLRLTSNQLDRLAERERG